ncbi:MAG: molybdenum cofactor guanylyltransferase [Firmicutes bacterium]|nr:molybdenum cofactor guanylyltransferase [Bacillota bacterium]
MGKLAACGVLLAGGRSTRMKANKALLDWRGEPLIAALARKFSDWFGQVVLITNSPSEYEFLSLPTRPDRVPGIGPLAGIESGLLASRFDKVFVAACDMPFLNEGLVRHMVQVAAGWDAAVPRIGHRREPLHAVYGKTCLPHIAQLIESGRYAVAPLFERVRVRFVEEEEVRRFGDPEQLFFNCNTPEDLARARALADHGL